MDGEWTPPREFEEYRLLRELGRGAMGQVWLAEDVLLERLVAIKLIAPRAGEIDETLRDQFFVEARAAARLSHPNVVTIHRVGEVRRRPFLVSELVRGLTLDRIDRPIAPAQALAWGVQLARGLAAAHRRSVLHRDLKPANVMIADDGEVKLLDFGLARLMDAAGAGAGELVGSPLYMAPEVWRREAASPRSDVFSLGLVLYEMVGGRVPFPDVPVADLPRAMQEREVPPAAEAVPGLDPRFGAIIDRCVRREIAERFESADAVRDALEALAAETSPARIPEGNPYRGLQAFQAADRALFFGRGTDVRTIVDRLRGEAFVLVAGDSGVGKSSLCRAGVLPMIEDGALGARRFSTVVLVPGRRPLEALAAALAPHAGVSEEELLGAREDPEAPGRALRRALGRERGLLVLIDQMEELITLAAPADAARAAEWLARLASGTPQVRILGTARSDFLTRLATLPALDVPRAIHLLRPLGKDELREAVTGPARLRGVSFESEALIESLVEAGVADGALPLLSFALAELWEARDVEQQRISAAQLAEMGGVAGALAQHADTVLARLSSTERAAARRVLVRLVTEDGTRSRRTASELAGGGDPEAQRTALEALVRGRLLIAREVDGAPAFELAHEALLAGWDTLRGWLAGTVEARALRQRLERAAAEWERLERAPAALYRGRQLVEVTPLDRADLGARELAFLSASLTAARRTRLRRLALAVGLPLAAVALLVGLRWETRQNLARTVDARVAQADDVLARAHAQNTIVERERRRSFQLFDTQRWPEGEEAWSRALAGIREVDASYARVGALLEGALSLDPTRADVRGRLADATFERLELAERDHKKDLRDELLGRLAAYDAGGVRRARLEAKAHLTLASDPSGAQVIVRPYIDRQGRRVLGSARTLGTTPTAIDLAPGSYRLELSVSGRPPVVLPVLLHPAEQLPVSVTLPASVPDGYVYVPAGRFLFGSADDEQMRRGFLGTAPEHEVTTPAYFIARYPVTFADWIVWLRALPADERRLHMPRARSMTESLQLLEQPDGRFRIELKPSMHLYTAVEGEPVRYQRRSHRSVQDWLRMPVAAVSYDDAIAYAAWLAKSRRVPGAHVCDEYEWERAARGADDRELPGGDRAGPDDFDHDVTYGRIPEAFGPDEVGSHPGSRSPFGVDDLAGNVWEWVVSKAAPGELLIRGGSWYQGELTAYATNREKADHAMHYPRCGMRICASAK